jgi:hypothetical protein
MLVLKPPKSFVQEIHTPTTSKRAPGTLGNPGTGAVQTFATYTPITTINESFVQGYKNSDYRDRLVHGKLIPMTPWTAYKHWWKVSFGSFEAFMPTISPYYRYWFTGIPHTWVKGTPNIAPPWVTSQAALQNDLNQYDTDYYVQAAAAKIATSGWDALTFVAEFSKTIAMFRGFGARVIKLSKAGRLESLWLEGRYGWRTLVYDMIDIDKAIRNLDEGRKRFFERVGGNTHKVSSRVDNYGTDVYGTWICTTTYTDTIGLRGSVCADIEPPRLGFNPISTAWELMRLSFVIDWFLNVGQFLDSLAFLALEREYTAAGGKVIVRKYSQTSSVSWVAGCYGTWASDSEGEATLINRIPASVSTIPLTKVRLNSYKVLDLVALVVQAVVGSKTKGRI